MCRRAVVYRIKTGDGWSVASQRGGGDGRADTVGHGSGQVTQRRHRAALGGTDVGDDVADVHGGRIQDSGCTIQGGGFAARRVGRVNYGKHRRREKGMRSLDGINRIGRVVSRYGKRGDTHYGVSLCSVRYVDKA